MSAAQPTASAQIGRWQLGRQYRYNVTLENRSDINGAQNASDVTVTGALRLTPKQVDGKTVELYAVFEDVRIKTRSEKAGSAVATMARELKLPMAFAYRDGRSTYLRLPEGLSPFSMGIVRTVASGFQFAPDVSKSGTWTQTEYDGTGTYDIEYKALSDGRYSRKKLKYAPHDVVGKAPFNFAMTMAAEVLASSGEIVLDGAALKSLSYDETLKSKVGAENTIVSKTAFSMSLEKIADATAVDWTGLEAGSTKVAADAPYVEKNRRGNENALDPARIGDHTFEEILSYLEKAVDERTSKQKKPTEETPEVIERMTQERAGMLLALAAIFRRQPDTIDRAVALIASNHKAAPTLVDVLGAAGSDPAQAALRKLLQTDDLSIDLKRLSAHALTRTKRPNEQTTDLLIEQMENEDFGLTALYGLGTAARRLREDGETARSEAISKVLVERLKNAKSDMARVHALRAIANSAYAGALDDVTPFLSSENKLLRGAAVQSLRLMKHPKVDGLIAAQLKKETVRKVMVDTLSAAKAREPSPVIADALVQVAKTAKDSQSRMKAVQLMASWLKALPTLKTPLLEIVDTEENPAVQAAAAVVVRQRAPL